MGRRRSRIPNGNGGANANLFGQSAEDVVKQILYSHGWRLADLMGATREAACASIQEPNFFFELGHPGVYARKIVLCTGLYKDRTADADFLLYSPQWPGPLALEIKTQGVGGTADEKLEHVYQEIERCFPVPGMVLLCGEHLRGAWQRGQEIMRSGNGRLVNVFWGTDEFVRWLTAGHPYLGSADDRPFGLAR